MGGRVGRQAARGSGWPTARACTVLRDVAAADLLCAREEFEPHPGQGLGDHSSPPLAFPAVSGL